MRWYQMILGDANRVAHPLVATECDLGGRDWLDLHVGRPMDNWDAASLLCSRAPEHDGVPDDAVANAFGLPVFSERLRSELVEADIARRDIQFLPIGLARSTGEAFRGFSVANVMTRAAALDAKAPECSTSLDLSYHEIDALTGKAKVRGVRAPALKRGPLEGHDVIRLLEFFPPIFVSARFVAVFDNARLTGATFVPVSIS